MQIYATLCKSVHEKREKVNEKVKQFIQNIIAILSNHLQFKIQIINFICYTNFVMNLQFFGAAGMVTGSNYLLSDENAHGILIDMGMFQGSEELEELNREPLNFDPRNIHSVFVTHAHLDHVGRLPILLKHGFSGKLYMTEPTKEIAQVVLIDAAKIMQHDEEKPILYTEENVLDLIKIAQVVSYGEPVDLGTTVTVFRDAGHILGSASLEIKNKKDGKIYAFSGDLGNSPEDLVRPMEFIAKADVAILESTYGDREHPKEDPKKILQNEINAIEGTGGALLIPSFSVERTQALLHRIAHFKKEGLIKKETPVYLDSPMGEKVTEIYKAFPGLYNSELLNDSKSGNPFSFEELHIISDHKASVGIHTVSGPKIILAGSGMMNGGRILEHALFYLPLETTRLLIVGFQAENTIGRKIEDGAREVAIYGENVKIKATVTAIHSMSAHADRPKLVSWLKQINGIKKVFLVHGEDGPRTALAKEIKVPGVNDVFLPRIGDSFTI